MENSSADDPRQHENEVNRLEIRWISTIISFLLYCFGMTTTGNIVPQQLRYEQDEHLTNLSELPKKCLKAILSFTTPRDVCRLAAVSRLFRSAANSDSVWKKFIPSQCYQILPSAVNLDLLFSSKRKFYFSLCDSILIDGGRKIFWLERSTTKIGYMLSAKELRVAWSGDQRCWRRVSRDDSQSRFEDLAELLSVYWLEIRGELDCRLLSSDTEYRVVFLLKFRENSHGWNGQPIKFSVKTPGVEETEIEHLIPVGRQGERQHINSGGWMEVVAGEFKVIAAKYIDDESPRIRICMKELESNELKGGLLIDGVKIEPKST